MLNHLLIIDPQNDFCDIPGAALPVPGANADLQRVADLIDAAGAALDGISITLDAHQRIDIAHPGFWQQADGSAPAPFTAISAHAVRSGAYRPREGAALERVLAYLDALEATGRYTLMVWPVHCEIGSWGQNVHSALRAAYNRWEERELRSVAKILKGSNPWTEHYSAIQAEVPDPEDSDTQSNTALIARLDACERIYICGQASSHCVRATTEHLAAALGPAGRAKLVLLTDCMSPVPGFEEQAAHFLDTMKSQGLRLATSSDAVSELLAIA